MRQPLSPDDLLYRRLRWRLVPWLLLLYVIAWFDRVNISFAALHMNADLGFSPAVYGLGAGIFFAGYALCEVPSNLVLARMGARRWIARIMVTWGILSVAMMLVEGKWSFYGLRLLLGVAEAGFLPGIIFYLSQWFPSRERGRAVSWLLLGIPLSSVLGGPLAGLILGMDGWQGLAGWQWLFVVEGIPAVAFGVATWFLLPDAPRDARWLTPAEQQHIAQRIVDEAVQTQARNRTTMRTALFHPVVWWLCFVTFACQSGSYGLTLWIPQIIRSLSVQSDLMVGFISAIPYAAAAVSMVWVGASSDRTGERFWHVALPSFVGAAGFAASAFLKSPVPAMIALTIAAMGDMSTRGAFWTLPAQFLTGSALAVGIALINTMGALGGFVGPYAVGFIKNKTGEFTYGLLFLAALLVAAGVATLGLRRAALLRE
jgi:MFS transporter, ACS family, tartrate transporter